LKFRNLDLLPSAATGTSEQMKLQGSPALSTKLYLTGHRRRLPLLLAALLVAFLLPALARAESFSGQWVGNYASASGERGSDSLVLFEKADGHFTGTWSGNIRVWGHRLSENAIELHGQTPKRNYFIKAEVKKNTMSLQYVGARYDGGPSSRGISNFVRR
jgi:hypothetical protein